MTYYTVCYKITLFFFFFTPKVGVNIGVNILCIMFCKEAIQNKTERISNLNLENNSLNNIVLHTKISVKFAKKFGT